MLNLKLLMNNNSYKLGGWKQPLIHLIVEDMFTAVQRIKAAHTI